MPVDEKRRAGENGEGARDIPFLPAAMVSGRHWHHLRQEQPANEAADPQFQDQLIAKLGELTGVALPDK